jgi:hypothetical protein
MCTQNHVCFERTQGSQLKDGANAGQHAPILSLPLSQHCLHDPQRESPPHCLRAFRLGYEPAALANSVSCGRTGTPRRTPAAEVVGGDSPKPDPNQPSEAAQYTDRICRPVGCQPGETRDGCQRCCRASGSCNAKTVPVHVSTYVLLCYVTTF